MTDADEPPTPWRRSRGPRGDGAKPATIYDVARHVGVSIATVSRALNGTGQIAPDTREQIDDAVRALGYKPNTLARSLVTRSTQTIALLLPDITNPFYPGLVKGVQDCAHRNGYMVLLCTAEGDPDGEESYLSMLRSRQVDGALVDGLRLSKARIGAFVDDGFPIVSLDRDIDSAVVPLVQVDNRRGARLATEHLLELGHRRIGHVLGVERLRITSDRRQGYEDALSAAGLAVDPDLVVGGAYTEEGGREAIDRLLDIAPDVTAVFAANDLSAIGVLNGLVDRGVAVPDEFSVVGFDDLRIASYVSPKLTTIHQPADEIGTRAAQVLIDLLQGRRRRQRRIMLEPTLVVRESSGPPG
jgi:DNA-binding LacI/PurR family transcriptional regulator